MTQRHVTCECDRCQLVSLCVVDDTMNTVLCADCVDLPENPVSDDCELDIDPDFDYDSPECDDIHFWHADEMSDFNDGEFWG